VKLKLWGAIALASACTLDSAAWGQNTIPETKLASTPQQVPVADAQADTQQTAATVLQPASPASCCKIAALTPVELEILTPASSKTSHQSEQIRIRVIDAVRVDGNTIIPAGAEGYAEVIQVSSARFGGKAGELVIGAPYLLLGTQRIDLKRFAYGPSSGRDRTDEAMIVSAVAGALFGLLDSGGNIDIPSGARAHAVVTRDTFVSVQPQVSSKE
jgi:hypothetical protein